MMSTKVDEVSRARRALDGLSPGRNDVTLELRSGESLKGEYLGFDGRVAGMRTPSGDEEVAVQEIVGVLVNYETEWPE